MRAMHSMNNTVLHGNVTHVGWGKYDIWKKDQIPCEPPPLRERQRSPRRSRSSSLPRNSLTSKVVGGEPKFDWVNGAPAEVKIKIDGLPLAMTQGNLNDFLQYKVGLCPAEITKIEKEVESSSAIVTVAAQEAADTIKGKAVGKKFPDCPSITVTKI